MSDDEYREMLINQILEFQAKEYFTKEILERKSTRILERIYDNVE